MGNDRFIRWQGYTINQLTFAINLFLGFAGASLGYGFSILRNENFYPPCIIESLFIFSLGSLCLSLLCGSGAVISRLMDFKLTANKIRKETQSTDEDVAGVYKHKTKVLGKATWRLFWAQISFLGIGLVCLIISLIAEYLVKI